MKVTPATATIIANGINPPNDYMTSRLKVGDLLVSREHNWEAPYLPMDVPEGASQAVKSLFDNDLQLWEGEALTLY
ncbi:MAG: hypothetical protein ABSG68_23455 [Thermoguttaceae bacterium]